MKSIAIHDTTLREGDQTPGVVMDYNIKIKIAKLLLDLGVDEVEAGFPAASEIDFEVMKTLTEIHESSRIIGFGRAVEKDIDIVANTGCRKINIFIPSSTIQVKHLMPGKSLNDVEGQMIRAIEHAKSYGLNVEVSLSDATRADNYWISRLSGIAYRSGAYRVILADTVGVATPKTIVEKIDAARSGKDISIGVHLHNDLGLATGNALIAIYNGVDEVQTTVGGIGERVGNTPLEELSAIQLIDKGFRTNIILNNVGSIVREILDIIGFSIGRNKPIIGSNAFAHTTDLHIRSVINDPESFEPFDPREIGAERKIYITHLIGKRSLKLIADMLDLEIGDEQLGMLVDKIRQYVIENRKPLTPEDLKDLVKTHRGD